MKLVKLEQDTENPDNVWLFFLGDDQDDINHIKINVDKESLNQLIK